MKKSWPIIVLVVSLLLVICISCFLNPGSVVTAPPHAFNAASTPTVPVWRRIFQWPEGDTALAVLLTLVFIAWQALLTRQAIASSETASQVELRAYLVIRIGNGSYQDRENRIRFEGAPELINTGKTPAHRVRYWTNTAILADDASAAYPFPIGQQAIGEYVLGVGQAYKVSALHPDYIDAQDVPAVMTGDGRGFYYWGVVTYDDAFGREHRTDFCHRIWFVKSGEDEWQVRGIYIPGRNHAT